MALAMARPWKHPKTGIFWLRRSVPHDLRPLVGKREEKRTLGTRDPAEAKLRHTAEMAKLEQRWAALRRQQSGLPAENPASSQTVTLTELQAHERAEWLYRYWLNKHRDNPSEQTFWPTDLYGELWTDPYGQSLFTGFSKTLELRQRDALMEAQVYRMQAWCKEQADDLLDAWGWSTDEKSRQRLAKAMAAAVQRASLVLERLARGDSVDLDSTLPKRTQIAPAAAGKPVSFDELLKGWTAEKQPRAKTIYEWSREVGKFAAFLGHDDAARVTPEDVVRWKEALIAEGRSAKTINDSKLAAVRTVLQWATENRRLPSNPAASVRMDVKRVAKGRRSFSDDEAATILKAALGEANPVLRWVPWLCAYSGARLSEICQLRVEDVREIEGIWCLRIDAEAGSVKTASSERTVPLHPAVLERGFVAFVQTLGNGPLFADLSPDMFGKRGGNGTKVLGRWVRGLGLDEKRLAPAHSWRHRMKTLARRHGLAEDVTRALMGHTGKSVADNYGEYEVATLHRELLKVPTLPLSS
ncbi:DUF6538 domain-containing protein [Methylobacterium sp. A49B]